MSDKATEFYNDVRKKIQQSEKGTAQSWQKVYGVVGKWIRTGRRDKEEKKEQYLSKKVRRKNPQLPSLFEKNDSKSDCNGSGDDDNYVWGHKPAVWC